MDDQYDKAVRIGKQKANINLVMLSYARIRTSARTNKHMYSRQAREPLESFRRFVGAQSQVSKMRA